MQKFWLLLFSIFSLCVSWPVPVHTSRRPSIDRLNLLRAVDDTENLPSKWKQRRGEKERE